MTKLKRSDITELAANNDLLFLDGFDDCLIGVVERFGMSPVAVYDKHKIIQSLIRDGCSLDDAEEYFDFNIAGAWVGEYTPAFITLLETP